MSAHRHGCSEVREMPDGEHDVPSLTSGSAPRTQLAVRGMNCSSCAQRVTQALQSVPGVASAAVNLEQGRASVRWQAPAKADVQAILQAVTGVGYEVSIVETEKETAHHHDHDHSDRQAGWQLNLWIGILGTIPLMLGEWVFGLGLQRWYQWLAFGLASIVQFLAGGPFYRGAWRQLKVGSSNMDTLVALGSTTAYAYSVWALFSGLAAHLYFMEAAAIITLISVGHWFEARVSSQASSSLRALLNLAPALARRRNPDGSETEVPVAKLQAGDTVTLRPGEAVPTDGNVIEGASAVDESMLTGESSPVDKAPGDLVYAGTVSLSGRLVVRITATGDETALAQIIAAVQRAQTSRANIQRLGDRVSSVFVPVVVMVALAAGLWWGLAPESAARIHYFLAAFLWPAHPPAGALAAGLIAAASVLIVACPCAMGLATPAAIMAGSNAAAQRGILIRDGVALEKAGQITAVLLDKTGTLTVGKPAVVAVQTLGTLDRGIVESLNRESWNRGTVEPWNRGGAESGIDERAVVNIAAALARHSTHPISQAVAKLSGVEISFADWQEIRGAGVQGALRGNASGEQIARLGSLRWLAECGVELASAQLFAEEWSAQGATMLGLAIGKHLAAVLAVKDTIKPGASGVVGKLHRQGLKVFLVTGDNQRTAASIARQAGIAAENVFADVRPEQKAELIKKLQQQGERAAFVGDGINDAPALEQADLGIAVARASDVAREAADIILLKSEIEAVPESLGLARATLRTIKQNLFWAFFYNAAAVPLAALGFLSPVICAAAMGFSDLIIIGNALRLRKWRMR